MSFIGSIREILKSSDKPLSVREILNRLKKSYPEYYGTPAQIKNVENRRCKNIDQAVTEQIIAACRSAREIGSERFAQPPKFRLLARRPRTRTASSANKPSRSTSKNNAPVTITWHQCKTYEEAKKYTQSVYLHEWSGLPFSWGKVDKLFFGGQPRQLAGERRRAKFDPDCKHWIEGCLRHGGLLFIGTLPEQAAELVDEIETQLISEFGHEISRKIATPTRKLKIQHEGQLPRCMLDATASFKKAA